ncbi:MAG TPA: hypothetical protein VKO42_02310 [Patescibacteria group bacterium]|nr:hypothetical protein [Patescibacteria group bacterium]
MASSNSSEKKKTQEKDKKDKKVDISQYQDPTGGLTIKKLQRSLWLFEHKSHLKQAIIIILFIICLSTWGYTLYYATMYLAVGMERDAQNMQALTTNLLPGHEYTLKIAPKPLKTSRVRTFKNQDALDIFTEVRNPSPWHYAYFDYCFSSQEKKLKCERDFIHPNDSKYIFNLNQKLDSSHSHIKFTIKNTEWHKIDRHEVPQWQKYRDNRLNIKFQDINFTPARTSNLSEKIEVATLAFTAFNDTSYNYYEAPLKIFLYKGNRIIAVNKYTLTNFLSQEKVPVEMSWPNLNQTVSEVEIVPDLNIFNKDNYFAPRR